METKEPVPPLPEDLAKAIEGLKAEVRRSIRGPISSPSGRGFPIDPLTAIDRAVTLTREFGGGKLTKAEERRDEAVEARRIAVEMLDKTVALVTRQALERAADEVRWRFADHQDRADECAQAIRALIPKEE